MAGSQGIIVPIQAKIEGWQEQVKNIQNAMKNLRIDSGLTKSLNKDLQQVQSIINNLGKNLNQRLTSDSQITAFTDKMRQVELLFNTIGQSMSQINFADLNVDYITTNFKDLLNQIDEAKSALSTGFDESFQEAITGSNRLQAIFSKLKIDPKGMNVDELKETLANTAESLEKDLAAANRELDELYKKQAQVKAESKSIKESTLYKTNAQDIASTLTFGLEGKASKVNQSAVEDYVNKIISALDSMGPKVQAKRAEIEEALKNLLSAQTVEEVNARVDKLREAFDKTGKLGQVQLTADTIDKTKSSFLTQILPTSEDITAAVTAIKERLITVFEVSDVNLVSKIGFTAEKFLKEGKWDQLPDEIEKIINETKSRMATTVAVNTNSKEPELAEQIKVALSNVFTAGNKVADANQANSLIQDIINNQVQQVIVPLQQRITDLEALLKSQGTEGFKKLGNTLQSGSGKGLRDAAVAAREYGSALEDVQSREKLVGKLEGIAQRWFSVYAVVRLVSNAIRSMKENITALDKTMTEIAIVTDMSQSDLWKQMGDYTKMARKYGSSIQGTYEVSQLYYQQGLERADVMALTEETLKMARISGLAYADATNYMTNAVRSFKIELQDASTVVDVYSALAASSASSTAELAKAMSKTASSAAAVGSSFEATSAMLAVMIETTRESPENIGSALKSIISRYGELKENKIGIDEEGEEYSLNKVDTALQSVGISIHDAEGKFRDFDEVIMELSEHWETIDVNTQRYIATVMAGNRQQSRFLALVSNGERLAELTDTAENSEDAATLQVLKTMDSIEYKAQQLQTSLQSLYTGSGIENAYKGLLDVANNIVETFGQMPTIFSLPIPALVSLGTTFLSVANVVMTGLHALRTKFTAQREALFSEETSVAMEEQSKQTANHAAEEENRVAITQKGVLERNSARQGETAGTSGKSKSVSKLGSKLALAGNVIGSGLQLISAQQSDRGKASRAIKGVTGFAGSTIQSAALGYQLGGFWGLAAGGIIGLLTGAINNIQYFIQDTEARAKRLKQEAEEDATKAKTADATARSKEKEIADLQKLAEKRHESAEAEQAFIEASNQAAESMPELIDHFDNEGNAILNLSNAYEALRVAREEANEAGRTAAKSAGEAAAAATQSAKETYEKAWETKLFKSVDVETINPMINKAFPGLLETGVSFYNNDMGMLASAMIGRNNQLAYTDLLTTENNGLVALLEDLADGNISNIYDLLETDYEGIIQDWNDSLDILKDRLGEDSGETQLFDYLISQVVDAYDSTKKLEGEYIKAQSNEDKTYKTQLSNLIGKNLIEKKNLAYYNGDTDAQLIQERIEHFSNANNLLTDIIYSQFAEQIKDEEDENIREQKWNAVVENLGKGGEDDLLISAYETLLKIPEDSLEELDELYEQQGNLTKNEFQNKLKEIIPKQTDEFYEGLSNYYSKAFSKEDWDDALAIFDKKEYKFKPDQMIPSLLSFGPEELRKIISVYDSLNKSFNAGNITENQGTKLSEKYTSLLISAETEAEEGVITNLSFTAESINSALEEFKTNSELADRKDVFIPILESMLLLLPTNVNTAIETYISDSATAMENYTKDLSKATKGMDFKAASELASTLGIDTSEQYFDIKDGALFLKDLNLIQDHYFGDKGVFNQISDRMQKMHAALGSYDPEQWTEGATFSTDDLEIASNELSTIIQAYKDSGKEWNTFLQDYFIDRIEAIQNLPEELRASMELKNALDSGKLIDIIKAGGDDVIDSISQSMASQLLVALQSGDFTYLLENNRLSDEFKKALPQLKESFDSSNKAIVDSLINTIDTSAEYIEQTDLNKGLLQKLQGLGLASVFQTLNDGTVQWVIDSSLANIDAIIAFLNTESGIQAAGGIDAARKLITSLHKTQYEKTTDSVINNVISNYKEISEETALMFQDLNTGINLISNGNGTYKINPVQLKELLQIDGILDETKKSINESIAGIADDYISNISKAASLVSSGTTSTKDMDAFIQSFQELGFTGNTSALFNYNEIAKSWTLDPAILQYYIKLQADQLAALGYDTTAWYEDQLKSFAQNVDISKYLSAEDRSNTGEAFKTLTEAMYQTLAVDHELMADIQQIINDDIQALNRGGADAVSVVRSWAQRQGREATSAEIEEAFNSAINTLNNALDQLGDVAIGQITTGTLRDALAQFKMVDDNGVVTSIENMVDVYMAIYQTMADTAGHTTQGLNSAFAKALTVRDQQQIDTISALNDAMGMDYETLGNLLAQYGKNGFESLEYAMQHASELGMYSLGNGTVRIDDFTKFARQMGWDTNSEEYVSAFKAYNDSLIKLNRKVESEILDEAKSASNIKIGDKINLTRLYTTLESKLHHDFQDVVSKFEHLGATFKNGILTINADADIQGIIEEITELSAQYGNLLPQELAELADTIQDYIESITNLIKSGISGSLKNTEMQSLQDWASKHGLGDLDFVQTQEGLKLSRDSAIDLYNTLKLIDGYQASIVFDELNKSLQESDERFKSISQTTNHIKKIEEEINDLERQNTQFAEAKKEYDIANSGGRAPQIKAFENLKGNVNMYNRPWIDNADGSYSTILGTEFTDVGLEEQEVHILMTPIPEWAEVESDVLSMKELNQYFDALMQENPIDVNALIELDSQGIEINGKKISNMLIDVKDATKMTADEFVQEAYSLHEWSDAWESTRRHMEAPDNTERLNALNKELGLAREINAVRSTQEDDSWNFMSNKIPAAQNNPLNYAENWTKAFKTINEAFSTTKGGQKGFIDYTDWYNIVTEMNNIAALGGPIEIAGERLDGSLESAANLIQQGADALTAVDTGEIKVDLSRIGTGIASSAEMMNDGVTAGIKAMADSQVEMLDGLIAMLELIVAMEELGDIDVDGNGLDFDELFESFTDTDGKKYYKWKEGTEDNIQRILDMAKTNEDLANALDYMSINGKNMREMFETATKGERLTEAEARAYYAATSSLYKAMLSGNYDLDNIYDSVLEVLRESGFGDNDTLTMDIGNTTIQITGGVMTTINWNDESVQDVVKTLSQQLGKDEKTAQKQLEGYLADYGEHKLQSSQDLIYVLAVKKKIKIDKDGNPTEIELGGKTYTAAQMGSNTEAYVTAAAMEDLGIEVPDDFTVQYSEKKKITGKVKVGERKVDVTVDKNGKTTFKGDHGEYDTQDAMLKGEWEFWQKYNLKNENGDTYATQEEFNWGEYRIPTKVTPKFTIETEGGEQEVNPSTNPELNQALTKLLQSGHENIQKYFNDPKNTIDNGNGTYTVDIAGYKFTFTGGENAGAAFEQEIGSALGIDTALSNTITNAISNAIPLVVEQLSGLGEAAEPLLNIANAMQKIAASSATLMLLLPFITTALNNLKININLDEFKGETIGQQIVSAIQSYLDSNPLKLKFGSDSEQEEQKLDTGGLNSLIKVIKDISTESKNITADNVTKIKTEQEHIKTDQVKALWEYSEKIDSAKIKELADKSSEFKDDKIFAAADALSKAEPKHFIEASDALTAVKQENGDAMKDASDGLSQVTADNGTAMKDAATALASVIADNGTAVQNAANAIAAVTVDSGNAVKTAAEAVGSITNDQAEAAKAAAGAISETVGAIAGFKAPILKGALTVNYAISGGGGSAAGNMGGGALAGGTVSTLMGELGPELVVSNGRYFLAGQGGAEFVDLAKDAIVFNHLQTQRLMQQGAITGHGKPITNERNAVSYAKGNTGPAMKIGSDRGITDTGTGSKKSTGPSSNWPLELLWSILGIPMPTLTVTGHSPASETWPLFASAKGSFDGGPAMASAKAALAALKQLRAQWKALAGMGAKDLAGLGGSGGGGGGGGNNDNKLDMAFVKDLELWYNWLQRIAVLEEKINYEEARRNEISSSFAPNGKEYYNSQKQTLDMLKEQAAVHQSLVESQQKYFDERRAKMNDSHNPFSSLYTFDEYGQLKYNNPNFESFMKLVGRDSETGKANMTAKEQYNEILRIDPQFAKYMEYDNSGNKIDKSEEGWEEKAVQAFWDKIDADQAEMQDLHNSIEEHKQAVLEAQEQANEILHEMEDNQLELENKVLSAIEESRQREIDELQKQRDALEQSSQALIDGLSEQLEKERDMYSRNEDQKELTGLQRQLAILQRSGGSASQIASLQKEISQKQQDAYFEAQQAQIDALQEASDKQLARLDKQIDLMTETLEYQKLYGMLWGEVYEVMAKSPAEIADYIRQNTESYWGQSTLQLTKTMRDDLFSAEQYKAMADDIGGLEYLVREYTEDAIKKKKEEEQRRAEEQKRKEEEERRKKEEEERRKKEEEERKKREAAQQKPKPSSGGGGGSSSPSGATTYISNNNYTHGVYVGGVKVRDEPHVLRGNMCILCERRVVYNAQGNAFAKGTLLGELGPEAWVAGGKFHIAGQAGAEMVDLPDDAIVFNHQQTANLLRTGHAFGRGKALNTDKAIGNDQRESAIKAFWNQVDSDRARIPSLASMIRGQELSAGVLSTIGQGTSGNPIIINEASVNMNVSKIANDYDAERAGEKALEKMISIARKTQAQNRVGR